MTPERFAVLADAYGAGLRRWPETDRGAAAELLGRRPELEAVLAAAGSLDAWLAADVVAPPPDNLRRRVLSAAPTSAARRERRWAWWRGLGLAGACAAGLAVGVLVEAPPSADDAAALLALSPPELIGGLGT